MRFIFTMMFISALAGPVQQFPRDPLKEMQRRAEKETSEKNYKELKEAAAELAELSKQINVDVEAGGKDVISVRIFDRLDKIEKLTKRIRDKAKGDGVVLPSLGNSGTVP